jgi:Carboxypeptidase regulatory-like domain
MTGFRPILCALGALLACSFLLPLSAEAAGSGSISGEVLDASSHEPIAEIEVCANSSSPFGSFGCDSTDAGGEYTIGELKAGAYKVEFAPPYGSGANYVSQYYDGKASWEKADPVTVNEGEETSLIDAVMQPGGRVSGKVTDGSSAPVENIEACARVSPGLGNWQCDETDAAGEYTISALDTGSYVVRFSPGFGETSPGNFETLNYVTEYYDGKATEAMADHVGVVAGSEVTGIDATVEEGGRIAGTVVAASGKAPLEGVRVCPFQAGVELSGPSCDYTSPTGKYTISGLASGSYKLKFSPEGFESNYASQYFDGKATLAGADAIAVSTGATAAGIDAELIELGKIAGTVKAAGGGALPGISVCASASGANRCGTSNALGEYTIAGLPSGSYRVRFSGGTGYVSEYYAGAARESDATPVGVSLATTTTGIDAELQKAGRIEGKAVDASSKAPLEGIEVCPLDPSGFGQPLSSGCATTDAAGKYTIGGLAAGSYRVRFAPLAFGPVVDPGQNYLTQYYSGKSVAGEGDLVPVTAGSPTSAINAEMHAGGTISGTVTGANSGLPIEGSSICATRLKARNSFANCTIANAAGKYTIARLATGVYKVRFSTGFASPNYLRQYYDDSPTRTSASGVAVTAGADVSGIDAALHPGGKIAGTVTGADTEAGIQGLEVCAFKPGAEFPLQVGCDQTGADGQYTIEGIPSGNYHVLFSPSFYGHLNYLHQYYDGKSSEAGSDPVEVIEGSTTGGIDAELQAGGTISGEVVDAVTKDPAPPVRACASSVAGEFERCGYTKPDGEYAIVGLPSGAYRVRFAPGQETGIGSEPPPNSGYASQYYDGKASKDEAEPVNVIAGAITQDIDAEMAEGGKIAGTVLDADSKDPLRYVQVCVYTAPDFETVECAGTDANGEYLIEGLATGEYFVGFRAFGEGPGESANYLHQYYDGVLLEEADQVAVAAGATTAGIDAEMHPGGQIEGRVTAAAGGMPLQGVEVCALEVSGEEFVRCTETNVNGAYALSSLRARSYKVKFTARYYDEDEDALVEEFATQYYRGAPSGAQSKPVAVTEGAVTGSIDAQMVEPGGGEPGGGEPGGGPPGGGGQVGGPPSAGSPPPASKPPAPRPRPLKCKRGFKKKTVRGKKRCVKAKPHRRSNSR